MNHGRFDALTRSLARRLPRRGLLASAAVTGAAFGLAGTVRRKAAARSSASIGLPCVPCNCSGDDCDCCLIGITGGGVVRTADGDANLILFATQLADDAPQEAAGFVRWLDANREGGLALESVGPIAYDWPEGEEQLRNVRGLMTVNGEGEQPFHLEVFDAGPDLIGQDTARLVVGDAIDGGSTGFGYEAAGTVIGGDIQLLSSVAPVAQAE
jgi:hypothetical protein